MLPSGSSSRESDLSSAVAKIRRRVLPLFVVMFVANYIDRVNIGFVRTHLAADIGLSTAAYGLGAGLFFIGYALFEVPSNMLLARVGARAWLTRIMLTWGLVAAAMVFVRHETSFYALRFALGVAEAGFFPGVVWYLTRWLPAAERGRAMAVFLSGSAIASVLAGPITGALLELHGGGLRSWQWMFLVEGGFSVVLGFAVWLWLDSLPNDAKWLNDDEKSAVIDTIAAEQRAREGSVPSAHISPWRLMRDRQIVLFCFIYFSVSLTIYGATFWLPSVIRKMAHLSDIQVGFFNSIPWLISIVAMYAFARVATRWKNQQAWVACTLVIAAAGMYASIYGSAVSAFVAICFAAVGFKAASSLFWPIPQNYLDQRIAAPVIALINSLGNLGGFVAPTAFGFLEQATGSTRGGMIGLSAVSVLAAIAVFFTRRSPGPRQPSAVPPAPSLNPSGHAS